MNSLSQPEQAKTGMRKITASIMIRHFFTGLFLTFITSTAYTQETIRWYSFEEAVALTTLEPRHIFVDVYTDWCGWCKKMDKSTFSDPVVAAVMNEYFYAVKFDAEQKDTLMFMGRAFVNAEPEGRRSSHQLAQALLKGKMSYPSFVFLNEKMEWLSSVAGYRKADEMEKMLSFFGEGIYKAKTWEQFQAAFVSRNAADQ